MSPVERAPPISVARAIEGFFLFFDEALKCDFHIAHGRGRVAAALLHVSGDLGLLPPLAQGKQAKHDALSYFVAFCAGYASEDALLNSGLNGGTVFGSCKSYR
jgi:hypothetical protein